LGVGLALLVREHGDQPAVARIEVEVALGGVVEVRLLEHERHSQHALPEVDRGLAVGARQRDVVDALRLYLPHGLPPVGCSTSRDLYSLRCRLPHGTSMIPAWTTSTSRSRLAIAVASAASPLTP